jgi:hypothetical protein
MEYLVEIGSISCLDYVKNIMHFEWIPQLCSVAARSGRIDTLKHLIKNGLAFDPDTVLWECTKGSCDLSIIKYLHENGVAWTQTHPNTPGLDDGLDIFNDRNNTHQTAMENMAYRGHLECMKYALENGCNQRELSYTPSIECLDFAIENGFYWQGGQGSLAFFQSGDLKLSKRNICEEAARLGDLTMLKYAHQKGALLNDSAQLASDGGHLRCLIYMIESDTKTPLLSPTFSAGTLDCFKYLLQKFGTAMVAAKELVWLGQLQLRNVEILYFMLQNGFTLDGFKARPNAQLLRLAVKSGPCFKFLLEEANIPLDAFDWFNPYLRCAYVNNLEGLKLAFERNLPNKAEGGGPMQPIVGDNAPPVPSIPHVISQTIATCLRSKNIEMVKLMWEKFPDKKGFNLNSVLSSVATNSTPEILDFLTQQGAQWTSTHLAAASENLPNLAYLTRIGCK